MTDISKAASLMGRKGGKRRLETMTREERVEIAKRAAKASVEKRKATKGS